MTPFEPKTYPEKSYISNGSKVEALKDHKKVLGDCLDEAKAVITGGRQDSYGNPENSFDTIASFWTSYIVARYNTDISLNALDIAKMMALFKIARMTGQKESRDNYVDACGYIAIAADRLIQ